MVESNPNVPTAFALVILSGSATVLGGTVVFFPWSVKLASPRTLAFGLGISAGVMTYVSFISIIPNSQESFVAAGFEDNMANIYSSLCFFAGVVLMLILNLIVSFLVGAHHHRHDPESHESTKEDDVLQDEEFQGSSSITEDFHACPCHDDHPIETLNKIRDMAQSMADHPDRPHPHGHHHATDIEDEVDVEEHGQVNEIEGLAVSGTNASASTEQRQSSRGPLTPISFQDEEMVSNTATEKVGSTSKEQPEDDTSESLDSKASLDAKEEKIRQRRLLRTSMNAAIAIGLHNFPEGLATFVSALSNPKVGAVLAVALAIHNIPEGLCVAMPVYYATGRRWEAFAWAALSGLTEPFAGFLGWLVLANAFSPTLYAVLFGMVAGMMVIISIRELLPTAHRYDPEDSVVTVAFIVGMGIMGLSLCLFEI